MKIHKNRLKRTKSFLSVFLLGMFLTMPSSNGQESQNLQVTDYRIGPKDLLEISVYELPELNGTFRVAEDGSITMSFLGKVGVAGFAPTSPPHPGATR